MSTATVSICIPAFQADRFLAETLTSIRNQTQQDWELVVVEQGSSDRTQAVLSEFAARVRQEVRFYRLPEKYGLTATRNACIAISRGEWIALLNADDLWTSNHLEASLACAKQRDASIVHGGSITFDNNSNRYLRVDQPTARMVGEFPRSLFSGEYRIQTSSVLLRRSLWESVGGFDSSFRHDSQEMWLRCARAGAVFAYSGHETCLCRYLRNNQEQSLAAAAALAQAQAIEKNVDWETLPQALRRRYASEAWRSAGRLFLRRDARQAREFFRRALQHRAFAPVTFFYWLVASAFSFTQKIPHPDPT